MNGSRLYKHGLAVSAAGLAITALSMPVASAETRSYAVGWVTQAADSQDGDCPGGLAPDQNAFARTQLSAMGKTEKEIDDLMNGVNPDGTKDGNGYGGGHGTGKVHYMLIDRGRIDGKPVNVYQFPTSIADPKVPTVEGKYAYGFNLDGKGAASPNSFEDPDTHEHGINNQYFRAMGCLANHRGTMEVRPTYWTYVWDAMRYSMPAWVITISGADLSKDGDATVSFERALEAVTQDANAETRRNATFRIDPDPRWRNNVYPAKIKDGVLTLNKPVDFRLDADPYVMNEWDVRQMHLRLKLKPDGSLDGIMGGYMPWYPIYYMYSHKGESDEMSMGIDIPGVYYNLRRFADAEPDPATGQNMAISVAFRIEAVPAFAVHVNGDKGNNKTAQAQ